MVDIRGFPEVVTARTQVQTEVHRIGGHYTGCSSRKHGYRIRDYILYYNYKRTTLNHGALSYGY